jgi:hypothetical protein
MGIQLLSKIDFSFKSYDKELVFFAKIGQFLFLLDIREKNFLFQSMQSTFAKLFVHVHLE